MTRTGRFPIAGIVAVKQRNGRIFNYFRPGRGTPDEAAQKHRWRRLPDDLTGFDFSALKSDDLRKRIMLEYDIKPFFTQRLAYYRQRAKKKRVPYDLDPKFLIDLYLQQRGFCAISGIEMALDSAKMSHEERPFSPSVDRIDSKKGYTKDNVRLVCRIVNLALSSWGFDPLRIMVEAITRTNLYRDWPIQYKHITIVDEGKR